MSAATTEDDLTCEWPKGCVAEGTEPIIGEDGVTRWYCDAHAAYAQGGR